MKIAVAHHSLNMPGGAERLCLSVVEALRRSGHEVHLVTVEKTDWKLVQRNFGTVVLPNKEEYVTESRFSNRLANISISSMYFSIFALQLLTTKSRREYDVTINTFGDALNSMADITYVHFPLRAALVLSQIPAFSNKSIWRSIAPIYNLMMSAMDNIVPGNLLTNSKFIRNMIKNVLHRNSLIVYPPVNVETFHSNCFRHRKDNNTIAVIASYTPKRHLEQVPQIAKLTKHARFIVMGKADAYSAPTLKNLKKRIGELHVEDRVKLLQNVPFDQLLSTLSDAKVYLHVMPHDHFGISVVEAMASGCVPIVHRSGGPWTDILDQQQGTYGFSYLTADEAANYIDTLTIDEDLRSGIALRASHRAKRFDKKVFMDRMVKVVESIAG